MQCQLQNVSLSMHIVELILLDSAVISDVSKCCYLRVVSWCVKLATMRVKLLQLKDEMDDCVQKQDFQRAAELKQSISELEESRQSLLSEAQPQTTEVRTEKVTVAVVVADAAAAIAVVFVLIMVIIPKQKLPFLAYQMSWVNE